MSNILTVSNITKEYKDFTLDNISFSLPKGSIMGLIGTNGAGKSTTIKLILNIISSDSGSVTLFGEDNKNVDLKQDIGVVFDENNFPEELNLKQIENIMKNIYKNWDSDEYKRNLKRFSLPYQGKNLKEFSRGMKMKFSLSVALSHHSKLLILDEPTGGLDPIVRNEILDIFMEFIENGENSILLSSHITTDLEKIADYIAFINNGNIMLCETKDELIDNYGIIKGGKDELSKIDSSKLIGLTQSNFGFEALVKDKNAMKISYPNAVIDSASLEDIMLFIVKAERT